MGTRELRFETLGGEQASTLVEGEPSETAVVLVAPALGVRAGYYRKLCEGLAAHGITAGAVDHPGHGTSPIRAGRDRDWGYAELVEHYRSACEAVTRERPGTSVFLLGHSIGGQAALMTAGMGVPGLHGVVLVASGLPWWRTWDGLGAVKVLAAVWSFAAMARIVGYFPGHRIGFGGREPRTLILQWTSVGRTGSYRVDGFDGDARLAAAGPPVLAIALPGDTFAPERSVRASLDRLVARDVTFERWSDPPHGGNHNRWPSAPGFVIERVAAFVREQVGADPIGADR